MKSILKTAMGALLTVTLLAAAAPYACAKPGDNIMLGAKLHESTGFINSEEQDIFLFDGDHNTKWCATQSDAKYQSRTLKNLAGDGFMHILSVDFGEEKYFDGYRLYLASTGMRDFGITAYNATSWKIQISSDGEIWKDISRVADCYDEEVVTVRLGVRKARYLRILVDRPEQFGGTTVRLYELEVYECEPGEIATGVVRSSGSNVETEKPAAVMYDEPVGAGEEPVNAEETDEIELGYVPSEAIEYEGYRLGMGGIAGIIVLAAAATAVAAIASIKAKKEHLY